MSYSFYGCSALKELDIPNFITNNKTDMNQMFKGISDELKKKIKTKYKNIIEEAFVIF